MGTLTLTNAAVDGLSFETEVRRLLDDNQDEPQARIFRFLQDAYDFVQQPSVFRHPGLFQSNDYRLNSLTNEYITTNLLWPTVVSIWEDDFGDIPDPSVNHWKLDYTTLAILDDQLITSGRPSMYAFEGDVLYLDALPEPSLDSKILRIRGYVRDTAWNTTSNTSTTVTDLSREWDTIICYLAAMYGWLFLRNSEKAMDFREDAGRLINEQREAADLAALDWRHTIINDGPDYMRIS